MSQHLNPHYPDIHPSSSRPHSHDHQVSSQATPLSSAEYVPTYQASEIGNISDKTIVDDKSMFKDPTLHETGPVHNETTDEPADISVSSTSSSASTYKDFISNGEIDLAKMQSWTLPSAKRKTKEWILKQERKGYRMNTRLNKSSASNGSPKHHSTPQSPSDKYKSNRAQLNRDQEKQLTELGYDIDSQYIRMLAHYNEDNVTKRRQSNNSVK